MNSTCTEATSAAFALAASFLLATLCACAVFHVLSVRRADHSRAMRNAALLKSSNEWA